MPTNPNMVAIQTVTVGSGGAANITFSNIPQTYTDLVVVLSARCSQSAITGNCTIAFNGTSANSSRRNLNGSGSTVASTSGSDGYIGDVVGANATASTFGNIQIYIPNYTSSNNKSFSIDTVTENNATTAYTGLQAGLWSNTAAITSVSIAPGSGTWVQYSTATLYGVTSAGYGAKATGGIITQDANYFYHTFLSSGTFTPTSNITADYLVVAGGGGGGRTRAGGGGAGGLRCTVTATGGGGALESALSLTASTNYTVTVGAGGAGGASTNAQGTSGSNSVFSSITSTGGGGGGASDGNTGSNGSTGGSGGGGAGGNTTAGNGGAGTTNQGRAGGNSSVGNDSGGGGGGAGAVGANTTTGVGGNGGAGVATVISGTSTTYAGGGGGGAGTTAGTGGAGGGGNGSIANNNGTAGTANTGGGGGGSRDENAAGGNGGAGGSGIVVIRYAK